MLIFVECPECKTSNKANNSHDVRLLINKDKEIVPVECTGCKKQFEISLKLKVRS